MKTITGKVQTVSCRGVEPLGWFPSIEASGDCSFLGVGVFELSALVVTVECVFDDPQDAQDYAMWFSRRIKNDQGRFSVKVNK